VETLGDAFPKEQARVRELLGLYKELGPNGWWGAMQIEGKLQEADRAAISGDAVAMLVAYENLKACQ